MAEQSADKSDYLCFVGRLDVSKGLEDLAEAWKKADTALLSPSSATAKVGEV